MCFTKFTLWAPEAQATIGGALPAKWVIHAVGPIYWESEGGCLCSDHLEQNLDGKTEHISEV